MDVGVIILVTLKVHSKILIHVKSSTLTFKHTASLLVQACVRTVYVIHYTIYIVGLFVHQINESFRNAPSVPSCNIISCSE